MASDMFPTPYTLQASQTTVEGTGSGEALALPGPVNAMTFVLEVTAAATESGDLLDVYVQTCVDGTNWVDVGRFTQILGNITPTVRYYGKINAGGALTEFEGATVLAAHTWRDLMGDRWRTRYVVTDAGTKNASFTWSVKANLM